MILLIALIIVTWGPIISWQAAVVTGMIMEKRKPREVAVPAVTLVVMVGLVLVLGTRFDLWMRMTFLLVVISLGLMTGARAVSKARR